MIELLRCKGCNGEPVDIGNFGRFLFVCPRTARRSKNATKECDGGALRQSYYVRSTAAEDWNALQHVPVAATPRAQ